MNKQEKEDREEIKRIVKILAYPATTENIEMELNLSRHTARRLCNRLKDERIIERHLITRNRKKIPAWKLTEEFKKGKVTLEAIGIEKPRIKNAGNKKQTKLGGF
jgi:hypothetical protein